MVKRIVMAVVVAVAFVAGGLELSAWFQGPPNAVKCADNNAKCVTPQVSGSATTCKGTSNPNAKQVGNRFEITFVGSDGKSSKRSWDDGRALSANKFTVSTYTCNTTDAKASLKTPLTCYVRCDDGSAISK